MIELSDVVCESINWYSLLGGQFGDICQNSKYTYPVKQQDMWIKQGPYTQKAWVPVLDLPLLAMGPQGSSFTLWVSEYHLNNGSNSNTHTSRGCYGNHICKVLSVGLSI
jgi:hypothetical protein